MNTFYLPGGSIAGLILVIVVVAIVVPKVGMLQQRKALKQILETYGYSQSRQALVRYVMLNRQCSEGAAYARLATFVKNHTSFDDPRAIERMFARDRQSLLDAAQHILVADPDEIDKI